MNQLLAEVQPHILALFAVFFRVGAFVGLLPGFGEASLSIRIKLASALAFTFVVYPLVAIPDTSQWTMLFLFRIILVETLIGLLLGIGFRLLLLGLQTAGTIAAQATSLSQIFGTAGVEPMPAMGHILVVSGIALAMLTGLHVKAAMFFVLSYELFPFAGTVSGSGIATWGTGHVSQVFRLAFALAMPFVVLSLLYNLMLGVINKAMPQLMVAFVGAPAITLGGLFLLFAASPLMLEIWLAAVEAYLANPLGSG